ncbi:MAG: hypothetical protein GEU90_16645 [Gemmatimonas sp.]|nr:hypothetical protein [Gemmatimonas sp.]
MAISPRTRTHAVAWSAAIWSGVIAGAAFLVLEMIMVPLFLGDSMWAPPRMIGAIVMGQDVLPPPATFDFGIVMVAVIMHFILSIVYAVVLALIIGRMGMGAAIGVGAAFGLLLYLVNFYGFTAIFPWFAMARNWVSIFAHIVFGMVAAWTYKRLAGRHPLAQA